MQRQQVYPLSAYPRITLVHLPCYPLHRGGLPLYALGEFGERLQALREVARTGVERCVLLPVRAVPPWHLPLLVGRRWRQKEPVYLHGRRTAYLYDGPGDEVLLRDVLEAERRSQLRAADLAGRATVLWPADRRIRLVEQDWDRFEWKLLRGMLHRGEPVGEVAT